MALIEILQPLLADEQAMIKKLRDRSIELDIESLPPSLNPWRKSSRHMIV
jgi:hypothetical protein